MKKRKKEKKCNRGNRALLYSPVHLVDLNLVSHYIMHDVLNLNLIIRKTFLNEDCCQPTPLRKFDDKCKFQLQKFIFLLVMH